jgi:sigma-B regulation protein RsbU (phosphoserine phosphatase)
LKTRLTTVILLAMLAVAYRGMAVYMRYVSPDTSTRANYRAVYQDGAMVVTDVDLECRWPAEEAELCNQEPHPGDRIVEIYDGDGQGGEVEGLFDYGAFLRPIGAVDSWTLVVERPAASGGARLLTIRMPPAIPYEWSFKEWVTNLGFDVYLPLLALATALFVGFTRSSNVQAFLATLVFLGFSTSFQQPVSQFPVGWREAALFIRTTALIFSPYLILLFFLGFPRRSLLDRKVPWLKPVFLVLTGAVWIVELATQFAVHLSFEAHQSLLATMGAVGLTTRVRGLFFAASLIGMILLSLASLTLNMARAKTRDDRRRAILLLIGAACGLLPPLLLFMPVGGANWPPLGLLLLSIPVIGLFPISFVYAVVRYRVFGIRVIVRRGLQYALVSRGFLVIEAIVIFAALYFATGPMLTRLLPELTKGLAPLGVAAVTLGLVAATQKLNRKVLPVIDRRFFRDAYDSREILTGLGRAGRALASRPDRLLSRVTDEIAAALHPDHLAVFLTGRNWPKLAPLREPRPVVWKASGDPAAEDCLLFSHRIVTPPNGRVPAGAPPAEVYSSRYSIAHLLSAASRGPEALDVYPYGERGSATRTAVPVDRPLDDQAVFGRFNARLVIPIVTAGEAIGFLVLGEKLSEEPYSNEDKELLLAVAEQMATTLEYSMLIEKVAEQEKLARDVQIARDVQARLFPQERPPMATLRYAGLCRSAQAVGGDYYDFLLLDPGRLGVAVGDIAGKGLPAALVMASLQALVRSHAPSYANRLGDMAVEINRHVGELIDHARFASLFFGVYEDESGTFRYVNAGHNPPIVLRAGGTSRENGNDVCRLESAGMVLGLLPDRTYEEREIVLEAGDLMLVFSDGIVEATNESGEEFGDQRLVDLARACSGMNEEQLLERVMDEVRLFLGAVTPQDDMTLIVARVVPPESPQV